MGYDPTKTPGPFDDSSVLNTNTIGSLTISSGVVDIKQQELLVTGTTESTVIGCVISAYNAGGTTWAGSSILSQNYDDTYPT